MNLRGRRRPESELINVIPMIDVLLVLLIFFMTATTFIRETDLEINLPEVSPETTAGEREGKLEIAVDAAGRYAVNGRSLPDSNAESLKAALRQEVGGQARELPLIIRADAKSAHQAVVTVMDAAAQVGFKRLSIATVEADGGPPTPNP